MQTEYFVWVMNENDEVLKSGVCATKHEAISFSRMRGKQYKAVRSLCAEHIVGTPEDKYILIWEEVVRKGS